MAKVYQKKGTQGSRIFCPGCSSEDMVSHRSWKVSDEDLEYEDDYHHFWATPPVETTIWRCGDCDECTEEPNVHDLAVWVCGVCGWQTQDEADAIACCG